MLNPALANTYEVALSVEPDWQQVCVRERLDRPYTHDATSPEFDCSRPTHRRMLGIVAIANGYDVSDKASTIKIIEQTMAEFGRVDILINNAGISGKPSSHADLDGAAFMRVMEIAVLGSQYMTSAVWAIMEKQNYGRIVNVSSDSIIGFGAGGDCAYSASKGATFALTRDLGRFSSSRGIKINAIMPSGTSRMGDLLDGSKMITRTYFAANKCAPMVVALCSEECPVSGECFTTGAGTADYRGVIGHNPKMC